MPKKKKSSISSSLPQIKSVKEIEAAINNLNAKGDDFQAANSYSAAIEQYEQALALKEEYTDGSDVGNCLSIAD